MSRSSDIKATTCSSCGSRDLRGFFDLPNMPTHINFLWKTRTEAVDCARGDIRLVYCRHCGLITNAAFDPERLEYREGYENSLHYSTVFQEYASELAERLIRQFELRRKRILEIGCGDGRFLFLLCKKGDNRGVGFDPSHVDLPELGADDRVRFVKDLYSPRYSDVEFDFVLCRQTLEHVAQPGEMLASLRRAMGTRSDVPVFFEVPNGMYTLRHQFIWDIIYEHPSYFTSQSLESAFGAAGFRVSDTFETFEGQYLCISAYAGDERTETPSHPDRTAAMEGTIDEFEAKYRRYIEGWQSRLNDLALAGKRAVLWGGGSKGITFLNVLAPGDTISHVVDLNPRKKGMFITGQGQRVISPESLVDVLPDVIIVANSIYKDEISAMVHKLGLEPEFAYL